MEKISLEGMEFYAYHGFYKEERIIGNKYEVNVSVITDFSKAAKEDKLSATVNYELLYKIIKEDMQEPAKLLEHLAYRILIKIFQTFEVVKETEISIKKLNPPVGGICRSSTITLIKKREEVKV
jgi:dihydroneopterin aldolase